MAFVDLDFDTFAQRSPFQLSGGQMRRVAIAGVVAMEPDYLIMDEPSAGLDPISRDNIFQQLQKIFRERKMGVLLITHSMEEAAQYASRLLVMSDSQAAAGRPGPGTVHPRPGKAPVPFRGCAGKCETGGGTAPAGTAHRRDAADQSGTDPGH